MNARLGVGFLLIALLIAGCGEPSAEEVASAPPSDCAALWEKVRSEVRSGGAPDGEARRQADLAREDCEGLRPSDYPPDAKGEAEPECIKDTERRNAPAPEDPSKVAVYFTCAAEVGIHNQPVYMFARDLEDDSATLEGRVHAAVVGYLEGPDDEEAASGYSTPLDVSIPLVIESVTIEGTQATINFTPDIEKYAALATTGGMILITELSAGVMQFPDIDQMNLEVAGDCDRFWRLLESTCRSIHR